jgi:hypothetical protein
MEASDLALSNVLSQYLPVGTEENHENLRTAGLWAEV